MTYERPQFLNPGDVVSLEIPGGVWIVGFLFSSKEAGEGAIKAVAELYNSTATLVGADGETTQPGKEG
jgi:hypothetical protein